MNKRVPFKLKLKMGFLKLFSLFLCLQKSFGSQLNYPEDSVLTGKRSDGAFSDISPTGGSEPFLPLLAPSPLTPFTNHSFPKLSGLCVLNFSAAESLMSITAVDCWSAFAPLLANVICCPQLEATLAILIGQSSKKTNMLSLNGTLSKHCISDTEQILAGQGAKENLRQMCLIRPTNLTEGSCPVKYVTEFENNVDTSKLLAACKKIDPVKECCDRICQDAISEAATKIAMQDYRLLGMDGSRVLPEHWTKVDDCRSIVLRWLASKLNPSHAKEVLRGLSNCNVNRVCPLAFPDMRHVAKDCKNVISNTTVCCGAMKGYVANLQKQSLVTNLQALDCATTLGMKLLKSNITRNIFSLCHLSLKDFSLQVKQESGCLLPSLPSDVTLDMFTGISFICDLNDNIPAPWPSPSQLSSSSCNRTVEIPALPAAASGQNGLYNEDLIYYLLFTSSVVITMLLQFDTFLHL